MFQGNVPSDSRIFEYCPRRIQLGWSHDARSILVRAIIAHLKTMESQLSQKRLAWSRCSPSHIGASAIKPIWSEGSWKSLAIVLFIKTIAIKKGWGKCDQASARSILPWTNSRVLRLRAQGSILYLIPVLKMNLTWIRHFNHGGASGTLKRTTIKSHKRIAPSHLAPLINNSREFPFRRRIRANFRCSWTDESRDLLNSSRILCQKVGIWLS